MEVQGSLGRQIQGISQQPAAVRLQGQCTDMLNMVPDVVDGTKSRMGTTHIAKLMHRVNPDTATHHYRRGDGEEEYFFVMKKGSVPRIFDKLGRQCMVTSKDAPMAYLAEVVNPREDVQFMTVADVTFMLNRRKLVNVRPDRSPKLGATAIVYSAYGQYGTTYSILINGEVAATHKTPDGSEAWHVDEIRTNVIIHYLYQEIQKWSKFNLYEITAVGTSIYITSKDGNTDWTLVTNDGAKGKDLVAIKYKVASTDLLPAHAPEGYKVQVWPTGSKPEGRYWLQAEKQDAGVVTWKETIGADVALGFDKNTMPYIIERVGFNDGIAQFQIRQGDWEDRKVGDDLTNPLPSFIDEENPLAIGSMFMTQNRMCFTGSEAVSTTRTSRFFDFFRYTVTTKLDTDPIDVFSDASEVYQLRHAVVLDGDTVLFSDSSQFILSGDKPLTPDNAMLKPATTFEVNTKVHPVATGDSVMFATAEGAYSGIREFYTDSYSDTKKAQPITSHVNRLIKGDITHMVASTNINRLLVVTDQAPAEVLVYDWLWQGTDKVQSAWHRWTFSGGEVRGMFYSRELCYFLINRDDGLFLEVMDMGDPLKFEIADRIRLDRQVQVTFTYEPASGLWVSETLPWRPYDAPALDCVLIGGWDEYRGGSFSFQYDREENKIATEFDLTQEDHAATVMVGLTYPQEFEPTQVIIKDSQDKTSYIDVPVVGMVYLNMDKYPDFKIQVNNLRSGRVREVKASNRVGGARNNRVGYVYPVEGTVSFPLRAKSTDVTYRMKSHSPHTLQLRDIEWTGSYNPTRRRV